MNGTPLLMCWATLVSWIAACSSVGNVERVPTNAGAAATSSGGAPVAGGAFTLGGAAQGSMGGTAAGPSGGASMGGSAATVTSVGGESSFGGNGSGGVTVTSGGVGATSGGVGVTSGGVGGTATDTELPSTCSSSACNAATPVNPRYTEYGALGNVTMYSTQASDGGACQYGTTNIRYFAAINVNLAPSDGKGQWQEGRFCGQCLEVTALTSQGLKRTVVRVMDRCADEHCGVDLGGAAPSAVMVDGFGRYQGAWRAVSCAGHSEVFDGVPSIHVKEGANGYWSVIHVRNPMSAVDSIEWQEQGQSAVKGSLAYAAPSIENYWSIPLEVLQASALFDFTVHYVDGTTAAVSLTSTQLAAPDSLYPLQ